jgi:phosphoglycerol transferase
MSTNDTHNRSSPRNPEIGDSATSTRNGPGWSSGALPYFVTLIACVLLQTWTLELWRADLAIPFHLEGDGWFYGMLTKAVSEEPWIWHNSRLGMPGEMELYDFPVADALHLLILKTLAFLSGDYAVALNLYYLLSFPLIALASLAVLRTFGVSHGPAAVASLVYAFLPFHFLRGEKHLFLSCYYQVPIAVMLALRLFMSDDGRDSRPRWRTIAELLACGIVGATGVYYAFFCCYFLLIAGTRSAIVNCRIAPLLKTALLVGAVSVTLGMILVPALRNRFGEGPNPQVAVRTSGEPELYGLKIVQLILPIDGHRLPALAELKAAYNAHAPGVNENSHTALGVFGCLGFLALLSNLFCDRPAGSNAALFRALALLMLSGVLLATIGGGASLFALLGSPSIRSYNRIVVYIAFFSTFAAALWLDSILSSVLKPHVVRFANLLLLPGLTLLAVLDQTTRQFVPQYEYERARYRTDANFVRRLEQSLPAGTMIFQLPYHPFPETLPTHRVVDYELFRGYIHSKTLRWSYGAIEGREIDAWQRATAALRVKSMVEALQKANFGGVYVDRWGYPDNDKSVESRLTELLGAPMNSSDGRLALFRLRQP